MKNLSAIEAQITTVRNEYSHCSTQAFMSEYAVSMSLLSDAASVAVPGLSFT